MLWMNLPWTDILEMNTEVNNTEKARKLYELVVYFSTSRSQALNWLEMNFY